ncbi:hypothetical protein SAMN05443575_0367 [Jatrophihabitans endophyticus]|uniref:Ribonuclease VapC n=1 Tax=Jatrophihabitans endophyticus TaxID=1206085 RepID=A0A1M5CV61_9ACTN|nr:type II toxin-antitoxin system VapC family toxin [Jatrophihabitans endophyticus]SHF58658.1 hypothetical protein SAMN05443575_0367 [Jatrophihabitans endophyticus]
MIVLDTNVVSELMQPSPDANVLAWVDARDVSDLVITSVTAAELRAGAALLPRGRRRTRIADLVDSVIGETFAGAVVAFDVNCSPHYADIVSRRRAAGRPISALDAQIAATCRLHGAGLATRNQRDFAKIDVELIDPWVAKPDR